MKTVLFFMSGYSWAEKRGRDAVLRYAREAGWRVQCIPYAQAEASRYQLLNCSVARDVKGLLAFWKPDGCIVECGAAPFQLQPADFGGLPVVFLDRDPETVKGKMPCVSSDAMMLAKAAFDELESADIHNFAFAGWYDPLPWSVQRESAFERVLSAKGFGLHVVNMPSPRRNESRSAARLLKKIHDLPKPLAIFAVNDLIAEQIASVCVSNGIRIPEDVAIVGVDNSIDVCENALVSLSSIPQDYEGAGRQACELLSAMFARGGQPVLGVRMNVLPVVRRASTRRTGSDARIKSALEFIRQFATSGIKVDEVVKVMGCSRRTADLLFKRHVGHSILSELTETRLARVKELLRTDDAPVSVISDMCGFGSVNDLDRVFKLHTGRTPNNWRRG